MTSLLVSPIASRTLISRRHRLAGCARPRAALRADRATAAALARGWAVAGVAVGPTPGAAVPAIASHAVAAGAGVSVSAPAVAPVGGHAIAIGREPVAPGAAVGRAEAVPE